LHALIDTSFLLLLVESGRDILRLIEEKLGEPVVPLVPDSVIGELKRLSGVGGRRGRVAELALSMAERMTRIESSQEVGVDEELVRLASEKGYAVVTADSALQKRLRKQGLKCIYVSRRLEVHILA
jgi:rRNA-processing protein FCF1